jgi:hypothetical protein
MIQKLKLIYSSNKILGVICYILALTVAFYFIFFIAGYLLIKLIWNFKIPKWAKVSILVIPVFFLGLVGIAWTGATTGVLKPDPNKITKQNLDLKKSSLFQSSIAQESKVAEFSSSSSNNSQLAIESSIISTISSPSDTRSEQTNSIYEDNTKSKVEGIEPIKDVENWAKIAPIIISPGIQQSIEQIFPSQKDTLEIRQDAVTPIPLTTDPKIIPAIETPTKPEPPKTIIPVENTIEKTISTTIDEGVKQHNTSRLCHTVKSPNYTTIKRFKLFATLDECLANGGIFYK